MSGKRKARAALINSYDESVGPMPHPARTSKTRRSKPRFEETSEYEEDPGRDSSRSFQRAGMVVEELKAENDKSKKFLEQYHQQTTRKRDELLALLNENRKTLISMDTELKETIRDLYPDLSKMLNEDSENHNYTTRSSHPLFQTTQEILSISHEILDRHAKAEKECSSHKSFAAPKQWEEDERGLSDMLQCGREYGEVLAESILLPGSEATIKEVDKERLTVNGGLAVDVFRNSRRRAEDGTWGQVAWAQMRALEGVIDTIPNARKS